MIAEEPVPPFEDDDELLRSAEREGRAAVRVARATGPRIVLGRSSVAEREVRLEAARAAGAAVQRRRGGGCAVWLDADNVIVSAAVPHRGLGDVRKQFRAFSDWIIAGLAAVGAPGVEQRGISDLARGGRKVGGACLYNSGRLLYYSTTLLARANVEAMERCLRHPPREPDWRAGRPHRDFVAALDPDGPLANPDVLAARLRETLRPPALT